MGEAASEEIGAFEGVQTGTRELEEGERNSVGHSLRYRLLFN